MEDSSKIRFDILTLFPDMLTSYFSESMLKRAISNNLIEVHTHNIRDWAEEPHYITDDRPFGGGAGMVLKPEPVFSAIDELKTAETKVVYLSPDGEALNSPLAKDLSKNKHLIFLSGHYEGIDQRIRDEVVDLEVSIGDYILTNGTIAAAVLVDCISRFIPGVLGEQKSLEQDSFNDNTLGIPQYTRPANFNGLPVPDVLLSGNHAHIESWRKEQRLVKTQERRPELLAI